MARGWLEMAVADRRWAFARAAVDGKSLREYEPRSFEAGDSSFVPMNGYPATDSQTRRGPGAGEFLRSAGGFGT